MSSGNQTSPRDFLCSILAAGFLASGAEMAHGQAINLSTINAGTGGFVLIGQAGNDQSGNSVASAGDVNGDGIADLIVGAWRSDPAAGSYAGRSYVVFGKSTGSAVNLSAVASGTSTLGFVLNGQAANDRSGFSVSSAGDVNGDGLADVIVGAPYSDPPTGANAGRSYVVFGRTSGAAVNLSGVATGTSTLGFVINGESANIKSRLVSSAGDVNGDGLADVLVAVMNASPPGLGYAGRTYVVFGKTSVDSVNLTTLATGTSALGYVINGPVAGEVMGSDVRAAGDVNGDGLADVIIGSYLATPAAESRAGRSYVVFGKADSAPVDLSAVASGSSALGFFINGQAADDESGKSVCAAGDVNGDGLADVIVGAWRSDPLAGAGAGRSYVVFGKADGVAVDLSEVASGTSTLGFVLNGQASLDGAGTSVSSAGDVNGDGLADVIVSAIASDSPQYNAGRTYVVLGRTSGSAVNLSEVATGSSSLGFCLNGQATSDQSGISVSSAGDVNGDGLVDVIVGAPLSDPPGLGANAGRSYVVFSPYTPATTAAYRGQVAAGNPNRQGIGIHRFGDDDTIFPDSRAWVDFDAGSGPGLAGSSEVITAITRDDSGLTGFDPPTTANVQWQLTTNRAGWSSCRVTVRYTDAEIAGLTEGDLVLYTAPTAAGPFVPATNFTLTPTRNEAAGDVASMPAVFALSTVPPGVFLLDGDANDDGFIDIADVTAIHNDLAGIASLTPDGVANLANIGGVSVAAANALLDHLANGTPLP